MTRMVSLGKILKIFSGSLILILLTTSFSQALDVPPPPRDYVTDQAAILSPQVRAQLNQALADYEKRTTNQVVIATFPSLEGDSLEDFSIRLAQAWKVGQSGKDNGVILLIFRDDRMVRIEVGYALESVLTDLRAGDIIRNVIAPYFRQGDFDGGIVQGTQAIIQSLESDGSAAFGPSQPPRPNIQIDAEKIRNILHLVFGVAAVLFLIDLVRYASYRRSHRGAWRQGYGFFEWWFRFSLLLFLITAIFRILFYTLLFAGRGGGGGGGGGFSGGGGRFGGGGASGRW